MYCLRIIFSMDNSLEVVSKCPNAHGEGVDWEG